MANLHGWILKEEIIMDSLIKNCWKNLYKNITKINDKDAL